MRIALAQISTIVGDFKGNLNLIKRSYEHAIAAKSDLVVFPELTIPGYTPRDLLRRKDFVAENLRVLQVLADMTGEVGMVVGFVGESGVDPGRELTNSAALIVGGRIEAVRHKMLLPTYDVFDEDRYFEPATESQVVEYRGRKVGITICEDFWNDEDFWRRRRYKRNPAMELAAAGADFILNLSASPWHLGKGKLRVRMLSSLATKSKTPLIYCNLVGGNDELIFDGGSLAMDKWGNVIAAGKTFQEDLVLVDLFDSSAGASRPLASIPKDEEALYQALVLGIRDYFTRCGFKKALLGLSGGIDSAVVAVLATAALGPENVFGVSLPSRFSSQGSLDDAAALAANLGIRHDTISIDSSFQLMKSNLSSLFEGMKEDVTEENLQARLRGVILMALSNKLGSMLLTTGNKSELAVGYCTLYGDMCGGMGVISDVPKTMVYRLARWINRDREVIPISSIEKPPSAELRPNQTDQDSLPPYDVLDAIIEGYVVEALEPRQLIERGFREEDVYRVIRLIDSSEYKRRQAAPGLRVTTKAFGVGRRIPIAQRFRPG